MNATEFRLGNFYEYFIQDDLDPRKEWWELCLMDVESLKWVSEHPEDDDYRPIPLTEEWLLKFGFEKLNHFTVHNPIHIELGRQRKLIVCSVGTPNEMVYIDFEGEDNGSSRDLIVLKNYDYDGFTHVHQLQNLYFALTGEELLLRPSANSAGTPPTENRKP